MLSKEGKEYYVKNNPDDADIPVKDIAEFEAIFKNYMKDFEPVNLEKYKINFS